MSTSSYDIGAKAGNSHFPEKGVESSPVSLISRKFLSRLVRLSFSPDRNTIVAQICVIQCSEHYRFLTVSLCVWFGCCDTLSGA